MQDNKNKKEREFIEAYETLSDALFRHSYFRVSNREIALDIVQDGFAKTWNQIASGKEIMNLKAFLYQTVNNLVIDHYRKRKSDSLDAMMDDGFDPSTEGHNEALTMAEFSQVKKVLQNLNEKDSQVITLRLLDGLSVKEIAEMLNESENTVSVRLHRAVEKAKKFFNP